MYTHIVVGCNDPETSAAFYDAVFGVLGIPGGRHPTGAYYGQPDAGMFMVNRPRDGQPATHANGGTIGFAAGDEDTVNAWHAAGLARGGVDEGAPGRRDMPYAKLYGAYLRDPVGNKLCCFTTNVREP
jgi:catechol 2,3-dioxygenase-like lactoylglutathione lyase family enzyme